MAATTLTAASTQQKLLRARTASAKQGLLPAKEKNELLLAISDALEAHEKSIHEANHADMENSDLSVAMRAPVLLTSSRIHDMARGVREVAALPDPIGET